ncbi:Pyruvate kinase [Chlamydiales bacterium SCGC AB-751-O23]|nr:Pyruvate kinase [Chlamydiales bacterium SCGC AB-751-O23]
MNCKTKIVCTIGPAVNTLEKIKELIRAGMNVARLNFSHGDHKQHREVIKLLKLARKELAVPLAIMQDTKGPEIRVGKIPGDKLEVKKGERVTLCCSAKEGDSSKKHFIAIEPSYILANLKTGTQVLFNDGYISARVVQEGDQEVELEVEYDCNFKTGNGINIPSADLGLPAMTDKDIEDIKFACKEDLDYIAASFIRCAEHVLSIRRLLIQQKRPDILIIAKIESAQGIENFDEILQVADGIMVARGDLGVEVHLHQVPQLQKSMIKKCYMAGKPVLTATQMLESMIQHYRPTRAEVSDVANSIYDGTSAVMLSGETAIGAYPIEVVKMMKKIIVEAEKDFNYENFLGNYSRLKCQDVPSSVTVSAVKTAYNSGAKAIFAFTTSGTTARLLSRLRPSANILTLTSNEKLFHQLAFNWGVVPFHRKKCKDMGNAQSTLTDIALDLGYVEYGDLVIVVAGSPFGIKGTTNTMIVESIGDVLVRSYPGMGEKRSAKAIVLMSSDEGKDKEVEGNFLILPRCNDNYLAYMRLSAGVILDNHPQDTESEKYIKLAAKALNIPIVTRATGATRLIKEGGTITLDPQRGVVYKGNRV